MAFEATGVQSVASWGKSWLSEFGTAGGAEVGGVEVAGGMVEGGVVVVGGDDDEAKGGR